MAKNGTNVLLKAGDLILMDVQMPHMDGYKATETIRELSDEGKAHIPIVIFNNAFEKDRKMAISKGMNDHIAKPIDVKKELRSIYFWFKNNILIKRKRMLFI